MKSFGKMSIGVAKRNLVLIFGIILFRILLDYVYRYCIYPTYNYSGFEYSQTIESLCISWVVLLISIPIIIWFFFREGFAMSFLSWLVLLYYVPGTSLLRFIPMKNEMLFCWLLFWIFVFGVGLCSPLISIKIATRKVDIKVLGIILLALFCIAVLYVSYKYTGFRFQITFTDEYVFREEERAYNMTRVLSYIYSMAGSVLPLLICYLIVRKKYILLCVACVLEILYFSVGGHKSAILLAIAAVGLGMVGKLLYSKSSNSFFVLLVNCELLLEIVASKVFGSIFITANFSRRFYFLPQLINYYYFDFFSGNKKDFYRQSFLRILRMQSPYDTKIANIISNLYMGTNGNANNGLFSEAYSNMGWIGCIVFPLLLLILILFAEKMLERVDFSMKLFVAFLFAFTIGSGNLTTGLITNGLLVCLLISYWLFKNRNNNMILNSGKRG